MSLLHVLRRSHITLRCISRQYASDSASAPKSSKKPATATSSSMCPADTVLPGVNYLKGQPPTVALADEEYPEWLWTILQPKVLEDDGPGGKFERAKRRVANRQAIKDRNFMLTQ